ncbi:MAG: LemA family protein [Bacteroidetes bacterium]|nr:MAG: LemA family protein [Bacteroidota bacterium]
MAKKLFLILVVVFAGLGIIAVFTYFNTYNSLVTLDEKVDAQWGNVQSAYQRRADLIPNLVATVQGAADFEKSTITDVIQARSNATSINLNADQLTPANIQRFQAAQEQLSGALSRLLVTVEKYPELKATSNFSQFQTQLEGTENRIKIERDKFNNTVQSYNAKARRFPGYIVAGMSGMETRTGYFEANQGAENAPQVQF